MASLPDPSAGAGGSAGAGAAGAGGSGAGASGLEALLCDKRLTPLWLASHQRLERSGCRLEATVHLRDLGADQRVGIDRLLGVRSRGVTIRVRLDRLDRLLRSHTGQSLVEVLTAAVGPLRDLPGERAAVQSAEMALWDRLLDHDALRRHPPLEAWLARLDATGAWRRLDNPEARLTQALDVLGQLPLVVRAGRSRLAARVLGDAHALDDTSPTGRLVTAALAHSAGVEDPLRAAQRRYLWGAQGVIFDEASSTVLTLGLRPRPVGPLTEAAHRWADGDIPLPVPLAAVQAERWELPSGAPVWACENPSVLAAAAGTGAAVICLEGWPSLAGRLLLRALVDCRARLTYHGDFGAGGVSIANLVIGEIGARPWRFGTEDHRAALARAVATSAHLPPLRGPVPDACWDAALAPSIRTSGAEVEEELVLDTLLEDLAHGTP
ncbi:MAG: TIGR02679 family protein [Acidimicrobiales bacterium]